MTEYFVITSLLFFAFKLPKHSWVPKRSKENMTVLPSRQEAVVDLVSRGGWAHPPSNQLWVLLLCALLLCCLCEKTLHGGKPNQHPTLNICFNRCRHLDPSVTDSKAIDSQKATSFIQGFQYGFQWKQRTSQRRCVMKCF